ncbi:uncharacterized protein LOC134214423 [Armigeres subalbatus]|uniref:uncharacterized protein LOC134214423 n=1 Tax=Armigeres subalbatus TaxID=124917 RepID=UPI002ED6B81B
MEKQLSRYLHFNGYLVFGCTLLIVFYESVSLVRQTLYYEQLPEVFQENTFIRRCLVGRWIAAIVWLVALAAYFMALKWKDANFLKPAKLLFCIDFLVILVEDTIRTCRGDGDERFIRDEQCLIVYLVTVAYVMYTLNTLQALFHRIHLEAKSRQSKLNLISCASTGCAVEIKT